MLPYLACLYFFTFHHMNLSPGGMTITTEGKLFIVFLLELTKKELMLKHNSYLSMFLEKFTFMSMQCINSLG